MKIIIATDDSPFSMNMINDFANRPLPADTKVKIISVYEKAPYMYRAPMGALMEQYATADANSLKFAKNAIEKAAISIKNQNPELSIITAAIEGIPKKL
jgi:hypothetical protein